MSAPRKYTADEGNLLEDGAVIAHTLPQVAVALANRLNNHAALVEALEEIAKMEDEPCGDGLALLCEASQIAKKALAAAKEGR